MKSWPAIAIVALLALIWLEVGGADRVGALFDQSVRAVRDAGKAEETPMPVVPGMSGEQKRGGILNLHGDEMMKAAINASKWPAPASASAQR
jgi:hypothetical protein